VVKRLHRFLRLSASEQWFLIKAVFLLEAIKLTMWLVPFKVLRRLVDKAVRMPVGVRRSDHFSVDTIGRVVLLASIHTPGEKTCFVRALATQVLLTRRGYAGSLHIGVLKTDEGAFQAHAWVKCEGKVVIGGYELDRYTSLTILEENTA
jgi:hypothetical protein